MRDYKKIMAQNILEKETQTINHYNQEDTVKLVQSIRNYLSEHDCPSLAMDISHLNIMDASKVTVLCSNYHYAKYPQGEISWLINSPEVKELVKPLNLGNIKIGYICPNSFTPKIKKKINRS